MEMECVQPSDNGVIVRLRRGDGRRPAFMEALPPGGPPRDRGNFVQLGGGGRNRSSSFFPDDAQYIGYLSDDERVNIDDDDTLANIVRRRRRELLGIDGDISFSVCLLVVVVVVVLVLVWGGVRPPTALYCSAFAERCERSVAATLYRPGGGFAPP